MFKRLFWLSVGAGIGAGIALTAKDKLQETVDYYVSPAMQDGAKSAVKVAKKIADDKIIAPVKDFYTTAKEHAKVKEAELEGDLAKRNKLQ
jgi:glycine/serine hydroxymethyltransferase